MRKLALILIVTGILIILYPLLDRAHTWYWQNKIFSEWEEGLLQEEVEQDSPDAVEFDLEETGSESDLLPEDTVIQARHYITLGILKIDKIGLKLPVLKGTNEAVLKIGAGLLEGMAEIGEPGNTVLTAHRSHTYGRFFNRLNELEAGDKVIIDTPAESFQYTVYKNVIIEAGDTSIFGVDEDDRILTLYTCDPLYSVNPTNRLIVQARMDN